MSSHNIEELCFSAADSNDASTLESLIGVLSGMDSLETPEVEAGIEFMLESWGASIDESEAKSEFCLALALLSPPDIPILRISLQKAFSKLKKSEFLKSAMVKATGVRDESVGPKTAAERFLLIESLAPGVVVFNLVARRFGRIARLDVMTSEISVEWRGASSVAAVALDAAARDFLTLGAGEGTLVLPDLRNTPGISAEEWRRSMNEAAPFELDDEILLQMALVLDDEGEVSRDALRGWWNGAAESDAKTKTRHPARARTLHELHSTLQTFDGNGMSDDELSDLKGVLESLNFGDSPAEAKLLAESLAMLVERVSVETTSELCANMLAKVAFWPAEPSNPENAEALRPWAEVSVPQLAALAELTIACHSPEYLAKLLLSLPLRCWNVVSQTAGLDVVVSALEHESNPTPDALLWIWKNKSRVPRELLSMISLKTVSVSLDSSGSSSAATQLKKLLISNNAFHKLLLENAEAEDMMQTLFAIQACGSLRLDEKQTILVKLSALSGELKKLLDGGEGERLFSEVGRKHLKKREEDEPKVSSLRSLAILSADLKDLISKQIPENAAAIAHARSYGDLKENAEYKAAKERQAFLNRRAAELERAVNETQPIDFSSVDPSGEAVPGSSVTLSFDGGAEKEVYHLLGAWDGDPDNRQVAYTSALGMVLNGASVGEEVKLPDGRSAVVEAVSKLPDDLVARLSSTK